MSVDSPLESPVTAGPDEQDKPSPGLRLPVLLLVAALLGGFIGGGVVAITTRDTGNGTNVTFAPGTNLKLRNGALDIQGVLARTEPAVVSIETDGFVRQQGFFGPTGSGERAPAWC